MSFLIETLIAAGQSIVEAARAIDALRRLGNNVTGWGVANQRREIATFDVDLNGVRIADGTNDVTRMVVIAEKFGAEFWSMADRNNATPLRHLN